MFRLNINILLIFIFIQGCHIQKNSQKEHLNIHQDFIQIFEKSLNETKEQIDQNLSLLEETYKSTSKCDGVFSESELSSIYLPKSVIINDKLSCFLFTSKKLEDSWDKFYRNSKFVSWLYAYDNETNGLRISPKTSTQTLFGDNLTFGTFLFYKRAVSNYPNGAWISAGEDINGTGKIIIYSRALKLPKNTEYIVVAADVRLRYFVDRYREKLMNLKQKESISDFFFYIYTKDVDRVVIGDISSDLQEFNASLSLENITSEQQTSYLEMESISKKNPGVINPKILKINKTSYFCSMGKSEILDVYSLLCSSF